MINKDMIRKDFDIEDIDFTKNPDGLVPVIVQDNATLKVLMLGYVNREALELTLALGRMTFYSRTRQCLWTKGETSGNYLNVREMYADCDRDTILVMAEPEGPACHRGTKSCFLTPENQGFHHEFSCKGRRVMVDFQYKPRYGYEDFLEIMRLLRAPGGCPWDREQTHGSIRRNFLEETYEVLDAIDRDDPHAMCEELGDVLMQIVFHAQIEAEAGRFTMEDVVDGVAQKLVYRHPHVFGGTMEAETSEQVLVNWEALKRKEKGQRSTADAVESVPHTLPALWRAEKIQSKTAKAGFDWSGALSALDKLEEEVRELRAAVESGAAADAPHGIREEVGDALFIAAKIAQMSGVDPEDALHRACDKFDRRFRAVEARADKPLGEYSEPELVALWKSAKEQDPS